MKTKPMWGLWLLMIVAPIAVFMGINYWRNLPPLQTHIGKIASQPIYSVSGLTIQEADRLGLPYFSKVRLSHSKTDNDYYQVSIINLFPRKVNNHRFSIFAITGKPEIKDYKRIRYNQVGGGTNLPQRPYTYKFMLIRKNRKKDIVLQIHWQMGIKLGKEVVTITPQMKPQN